MFNVNIPTRIISGKGCVKENASLFDLGKKAMIVCGRSGAKKSGALDDVLGVLSSLGIGHVIFDEVTENPPLLLCHRAGEVARAAGCDLIIGIGGGSAMDAAKAISAFCANEALAPEELFDVSKVTRVLPLIAIPTTAGTGSEANHYSVMSLPDGERKRSFVNPLSYPKYAFLDPTYTLSLSEEFTISTALDAFHHAMESYLSPKATDFSSLLALYAAEAIWDVLSQIPENYSYEQREKLLYASCAAGIAISVTGTGFPHPLGYSLTMLKGIPHGRACAAFAAAYLEYNARTEEGAERLERFYSYLGVKPRVLSEFLTALAGVDFSLSDDEIEHYVSLVKDAGNYKNSPYVLSFDEMKEIYKKLFK